MMPRSLDLVIFVLTTNRWTKLIALPLALRERERGREGEKVLDWVTTSGYVHVECFCTLVQGKPDMLQV